MDFRDVVRRHLASHTAAGVARQSVDDSDIVDELAQHLADLYQEGRGVGLDHHAALARAVAALPESPHTLRREMSGGMAAAIAGRWADGHDAAPPGRLTMLSDLRRDLRYSVRMLAHTPAFTLVVVLTLALGIGANAAIFSAVDAILLRDAPVTDPDRVVSLYTSSSDGRTQFSSSSYPDYVDLRDSGVFAGLAAFSSITVSFEGREVSEHVTGEIVSGNYFDVLGVSPVLGRAFAADEDRVGIPVRVAVVSNSFWRRNLGSDPAAVGRDIKLNGTAHTVVGVAPPGFTGPVLGRSPEIWVPMAEQTEMRPPSAGVRRQLGHANLLGVRDIRWLNTVGRLESSATAAKAWQGAAASVDLIARRLEAQYPDSNRGRSFTVLRLGDGPGVRLSARPMLGVLSGAVLLVLLIACANVASLLAARAVSRRREVAIRMAVGAARGRLIRQWLTESLLLAILGSAGALLVARWFTPMLYGFGIPESVDLTLDRRVFAFTLAAGVMSGLLFGLAPVLQGLRRDTLTALRDEGGAIASGLRAARLRSAFVVLQVALSLMLLVAAGLFLRTLENAYAVDLGYRSDGVLVVDVNLDVRGYSPESGQDVFRRLFEKIGALPGVQNVGASRVPVLNGSARMGTISLDGRPVARDGSNGLTVRINVTSDRYLETMGIPVLAGRAFQPSDDMRAPRAAIVSRALATRLWPGQDPLGRTLDAGPAALRVVGVVPDAVYASAIERDPPPFFYVPLAQNYESGLTLVVRTAGDPLALLPSVRQALRDIDSQLVLARPRTLADEFARSIGDQRLMATLVGLFGGLALLLAAVGLYGVMAHTAGQRRTEIGIRLALGARPATILRMIIGEGLRLVAIGGTIGIAGALVASRAVEHQLFGVRPLDPTTYVVVAVVLTVVAAAACAIPARRAMRVDPVVALRNA
jgi:putative ABC transport system permease protein